MMIEKKKTYNYLLWGTFFIFVHLASSLPGFNIKGVGLLYPLRICLPFMFAYIILNYKRYGYTNLMRHSLCFILLLITYGMFSFIWVYDKTHAVKQLGNYIFVFMLFFVVISTHQDKERIYNLIIANMVVLFMLMGMGLYESLTGNYFFSTAWTTEIVYPKWGTYYPVVSFGNPNDFIFVLFGFMPFINMAIKNTFTGNKKYFGWFIRILYLVLYSILAFLASCRMGMLLLPFALLLELLFTKKNKLVWLGILAIIIGAITIISLNFNDIILKFSNSPRIQIWLNMLKNAEYYHYMGVGIGNSYLQIEGIEYEGMISNPHFWFLEIFTEFGIICFGFLILWYLEIFFQSLSYYKECKTTEDKKIKSTVLKFAIYFVPMSVMGSSIAVMPQFWVIMAVFIICAGMQITNGVQNITHN